MSYITNANAGQGLLFTGKTIIPFIDNYPTDTKTFKVMTTTTEDIDDSFINDATVTKTE